MNSHVFISYASTDSKVANQVVTKLEAAGIPCWIAPRNIIPGSKYAASIIQGLKEASVLVIIFSQESNKSEAVENEIENAHGRKIPLISFRIVKEQYSNSLAY